jgi:hypothetical protein
MLRRTTALVVLCGFWGLAGGASAAPNVVDQYTEQVPTAGGDKPSTEVEPLASPPSSGPASDQPADGGVSPGSGASGGSGNAGGLSAPASRANPDSGSGGDAASTTPTSPKGGSASAADEDGAERTAETGGMGLAFPTLLAAALVLVVVLLIRRRRDDPVSEAA